MVLNLKTAWLLASMTMLAAASGPTPIYINQVPLYSSLSSCAEAQVSTIVRDMYSGCGDGSQTTSFACFCVQSSMSYNSIISTAVSKQCLGNTNQASSALQVFASYCALGDVEAVPTSSSSSSTTMATQTSSSAASSTAAPAATATTASSPTATSTPISGVSNQDSVGASGNSTTIGVAVGLPLGVIAVFAVVLLLCLRRRRQQRSEQQPEPWRNAMEERWDKSQSYKSPLSQYSPLKEEYKSVGKVAERPVISGGELDSHMRAELDA